MFNYTHNGDPEGTQSGNIVYLFTVTEGMTCLRGSERQIKQGAYNFLFFLVLHSLWLILTKCCAVITAVIFVLDLVENILC